MHFKSIEGVRYYSPGFGITAVERKVEGFTQRYFKLFLAAAFAVVVVAWISIVQDIARTIAFVQFLHGQ